ncbi:MAG: hypothetical protein GWM98_29065 [Nitrospinaceae bacterium]|nr:sel1 repeat family protein [Nitrospinaceae bacterium]NIS88223.1 sel1 repeat family protein [Nitrospinaceae bacterium]NIT85103.1 sel1 repeat family protein [Nitrospinaceae bacterium]NIU47260.1 sel1 repeat family protein [Nitrospinaceae bacterium]NIW08824.1 hypothetical protein [Nitrospinaceae bacterium]
MPRNLERSLVWTRRAADQGVAGAQMNLGWSYMTGNLVEQDLVQAHLWFARAVQNGIPAGRTMMEEVEKHMTPDQVARARKLAQDEQKKK